MKRLLLLGMLLASTFAAAQFTTVTATVVDPNGLPYAGGTVSAKLVSSASPTLNGFAYTPPTQPTGLNKAGQFTIRLADNTVLLPAASTWTFNVCSSVGTILPAGGTGPVCFTVSGVTISGASQDISATLNASALALSLITGGGGGTTINPTNGVVPFRLNATTFNDSPFSVASGNVSDSGNLTINGTPASSTFNSVTLTSQVNSFATQTVTAAVSATGFNQVTNVNPAGASASNIYGYATDFETPAANTQNFSANLLGTYILVQHNGSGNITYGGAFPGLGGIGTSVLHNGSGTVTEQTGFHATSANEGTGNVTTLSAYKGISGFGLGAASGTTTQDITFFAGAPGLPAGGGIMTHHYGFRALAGQTGGTGNPDGWAFFSDLADKSQFGIVTGASYSTVNSNGGLTGIGGDGTGLTPNTANTGYVVPCNTGASTLCTVANRFNLSWGSGHFGAIPAVGTVGTSGHTVTFAANGIDLQDGGATGAQAIPRVARWNYVTSSGAASLFSTAGGASIIVTEQGTASGFSAVSGSEDAYTQYQTGAVSGNQAGITENANPASWVQGRNVYLALRLKDNTADLTNQRIWFGLTNIAGGGFGATDTALNGDAPCATTLKCAMFRYSSVAADTNWQCVTGTAAAQTTTNSGTTADTNWHVFEIQFNDSVPNVVFKIDGTTVCTNTTNLPTGVNFNPYVMQTTQTAAAKQNDISWFYVQADR